MKKPLLTLIFLLPFSAFSQTIDADKAALIKFYDATNGPAWYNHTNWKSDTSPCEWYGVSCENGRVTTLQLDGNNLSGAIPIETGELSALKVLSLPNNNLSGTIPAELNSLTELERIHIYANDLTGPIPSQLADLQKLQVLQLSDNALTGEIPSQIFSLPELYVLDLGQNQLSGNISSLISNAKKLQVLNLGVNNLSGQLPSGIGELTELTVLALGINGLSGVLPSSLTSLTKLIVVNLSSNNFSGIIPDFLKNQSELQVLSLSNNQFTGGVPRLAQILAGSPFSIESNRFNFDAIEPNLENLSNYSPQGLYPLQISGRKLSINAGGTLANNTYRWYKNGALLAVNKGIDLITLTEDDVYWAQVTNDLVPDFTLYSQSYTFNSSLPVTMVSFKAKKAANGNLISWSTSSETGNAAFELQKSLDAVHFSVIAKIDGNGDSKELENYQYLDSNASGLTYYRLNQMDHAGTSTLSRMIHVSDDANALKVYPNPAKRSLTVENNAPVLVEIYNLNGQKISEKSGNALSTFNTESWASGAYIIKAGAQRVKVLVEK